MDVQKYKILYKDKDRRASHRRTQRRATGAPALRALHSQRRLGRDSGHRVQPGPSRHRRRRATPSTLGQPAHPPDQHSRPGRLHQPTPRPAPTHPLALASRVREPLDRRDGTTRHDTDERTVLLSRRPFTEVDRVGAPGLEAAFTPLSIVTGGTPEGAARPGIDHIALSRHLRPERVWGRPNDVAGHRLSDHDGSGADIIAVTT